MHLQGSFPSTAVPEAAKEENGMSKDMPAAARQENSPQTSLPVDVEEAVRRKAWPAAKRGNVDPEADRIARIMASVRASPWQHQDAAGHR